MDSVKKMLHSNHAGHAHNEPAVDTNTAAPMQTTHENPAMSGTTTHTHHHDPHQPQHHAGRDAALAGGAGAGAYGVHDQHEHAEHRRGGPAAMSEGTASVPSSTERGGARGADMAGAGARNAAAEADNNFPGTNPHPALTALGGGRGSAFPGHGQGAVAREG